MAESSFCRVESYYHAQLGIPQPVSAFETNISHSDETIQMKVLSSNVYSINQNSAQF